MTTTIICAGLMRSGSTWQYNIVRMLASATGRSVYCSYIADYDSDRSEEIHVVKAHKRSEAKSLNRAAVVTSYRDLRDVFASRIRMWGKFERPGEISHFFDDYVSTLADWEPDAVHSMRYETMMADQLAETRRTAAALKFDLTQPQLAATLRKQIEEMRGEWLAKRGYAVA